MAYTEPTKKKKMFVYGILITPPCNVDLKTEQGPGASSNKGIPTTRKIYQTPFATANVRANGLRRFTSCQLLRQTCNTNSL